MSKLFRLCFRPEVRLDIPKPRYFRYGSSKRAVLWKHGTQLSSNKFIYNMSIFTGINTSFYLILCITLNKRIRHPLLAQLFHRKCDKFHFKYLSTSYTISVGIDGSPNVSFVCILFINLSAPINDQNNHPKMKSFSKKEMSHKISNNRRINKSILWMSTKVSIEMRSMSKVQDPMKSFTSSAPRIVEWNFSRLGLSWNN